MDSTGPSKQVRAPQLPPFNFEHHTSYSKYQSLPCPQRTKSIRLPCLKCLDLKAISRLHPDNECFHANPNAPMLKKLIRVRSPSTGDERVRRDAVNERPIMVCTRPSRLGKYVEVPTEAELMRERTEPGFSMSNQHLPAPTEGEWMRRDHTAAADRDRLPQRRESREIPGARGPIREYHRDVRVSIQSDYPPNVYNAGMYQRPSHNLPPCSLCAQGLVHSYGCPHPRLPCGHSIGLPRTTESQCRGCQQERAEEQRARERKRRASIERSRRERERQVLVERRRRKNDRYASAESPDEHSSGPLIDEGRASSDGGTLESDSPTPSLIEWVATSGSVDHGWCDRPFRTPTEGEWMSGSEGTSRTDGGFPHTGTNSGGRKRLRDSMKRFLAGTRVGRLVGGIGKGESVRENRWARRRWWKL